VIAPVSAFRQKKARTELLTFDRTPAIGALMPCCGGSRRPSDRLTVLLRIDGCRGCFKVSLSLPKEYLRSPGTVCRVFAIITPGWR
jgi:hypothetical protein